MATLINIEGVGKAYAEKLKAGGIRGTKTLLKQGTTRQGRKQIAENTGIDEGKILEWVNRVDLMRIKGVGEEYSDLLECAGVDTIAELARRNADNLAQTLATCNMEKKVVRRLPAKGQVADWIAQAGKLPRVITY